MFRLPSPTLSRWPLKDSLEDNSDTLLVLTLFFTKLQDLVTFQQYPLTVLPPA